MNVKHFYKYVLVFLLSVSVFSGCGNGSSSSTPTEQNLSSQRETNTSNEEENLSTQSETNTSYYVPPVSTPTPVTQKTTISGYVLDDPIENANISIFSTDGELIKENLKSNVDGYFKVEWMRERGTIFTFVFALTPYILVLINSTISFLNFFFPPLIRALGC